VAGKQERNETYFSCRNDQDQKNNRSDRKSLCGTALTGTEHLDLEQGTASARRGSLRQGMGTSEFGTGSERASQKDSPEAAVELYKVHRLDGGSAAARSVFDVVLTKEPWFAQSVAALLEKDNQKVAAGELRNSAKAAGGEPA
jgi:hypothetical protein